MKTFVAVMNIPSPYRLHSLGEWGRQLKERGFDFHCHFMARGHADRPKSWLNPHIDFPHSYWADWGHGEYHFNPGLVWKLLRNPPDVLHIGSSFDTVTGILLALFCKAKVISIGLEGNTKTPGKLGGFVGWFKRFIIGRGQFATVPGSDAAAYISLHQKRTKKKMPTPIIFPNLVDERRFGKERFCKGELSQVRTNAFAAAETDRVCLIPARLEDVKGLVPFFGLLDKSILDGWRIVVVGQGPLREKILETVAQRHIQDHVKILDYVAYNDMPGLYAASDLVLLPSVYDPNPLTSVETLHTGLPLALSDQAGNVEEAVTDGVNGWRLPVLAKVAYAEKLKVVFATPKARLQEMGRMSKEVNARFWDSRSSTAQWLDQLLEDFQ